ncbi:MAG: hypothetical protein GY708_01715 [Actinomycetia bacterium]|nr:hypothetical protein [Actinomycetes bacterium]MCP4960961.1 hypothetical protein [Actinomycetes bacterium]
MKIRLIISLLAVLVFTASCDGGSGDASADPFADLPVVELDGTDAMLIAAVDRTNEVSSYRFAMLMSLSMPLFDMDELRIEADGTLDMRSGEGRFVIDMSSMLESVPAEATEMFGDGKVEVRTVGSVAYMKFPAMAQMMGSSSEWVAFPADLTGDAVGSMGLAFEDPAMIMEDLRAATSVTELRRQTIGEIETTMFEIELDTEQIDPLGLVSGDMPLLVWIDDHGVLRRIEVQFDMMGMTGGVVVELFDFGVEVDVEAPSDYMTIDPTVFG